MNLKWVILIAGGISTFVGLVSFISQFIPDVLKYPFSFIIACLIFLLILTINNSYTLEQVRKGLNLHDNFASIVLDVSKNIISEYIGKRSIKAEEFMTSIVENLNNAVHKASKILLETYRKELTPKEIKNLLKKYEEGKLSLEEAQTLRNYLEEEEERRRQAGDIFGAILIGILLLGVLAFIATSKHNQK